MEVVSQSWTQGKEKSLITSEGEGGEPFPVVGGGRKGKRGGTFIALQDIKKLYKFFSFLLERIEEEELREWTLL